MLQMFIVNYYLVIKDFNIQTLKFIPISIYHSLSLKLSFQRKLSINILLSLYSLTFKYHYTSLHLLYAFKILDE
jgi:hypothetical protein